MAVSAPIVVAPPAAEPVTVAQAKAHLQQDLADDDAEIALLVTAARKRCEAETNRAFVTQTWKVVFDRFPPFDAPGWDANLTPGFPSAAAAIPNPLVRALRLPGGKVQAVSELAYYDSAGTRQVLAANTDYLTHLAHTPPLVYPFPGHIWPVTQFGRLGTVEVTYTAGYGNAAAVPEDLAAAILLVVRYWYDNRGGDADPYTLGLPMGAERIINGYRLPEYR